MRAPVRSALVVTSAALAFAAASLPATAAASGEPNPAGLGQSLQPLTCDGLGDIVVRTNNDNSSEMGGWSAAHIVEGGTGTLIPTTFTFAAYDETTGSDLFPGGETLKGGGSGNHRQPVLTCTQSMTGSLADFLDPGEEVPPGAALTDTIDVTLAVTAVYKG